MYLVTKWFGTFLVSDRKIKDKILFPNDLEEIKIRLEKIKNKEILDEEIKISKNQEVIVNEKRLSKIGKYESSNSNFKKININSEDYGFKNDLLIKASNIISHDKILDTLSSKDLQVIQMVNSLDDFYQISNMISERLQCWNDLNTDDEKNLIITESYDYVNDKIKKMEKQIEEEMKIVAPNISNIIGPLIGARLISFAGGLQRLATFPASTVQILGAEKALFRFKKEGGRPPKHGVIFQHTTINGAPRKIRGRLSRVYANKISIAAKADFFTKRDIAKDLKKELEENIKKIRNL